MLSWKKAAFAATGLFSVLLWTACARDLAALQLARYVNQDILTIAELEQKPLERYAAVTGENYTSDRNVRQALENFVVPYYGRFLDSLRRIHPPNEELAALHGVYLQGAELLYAGFRTKLAGIEAGDEAVIRAGNGKIEAGRVKIAEWRTGLDRLYQKYDAVKTK